MDGDFETIVKVSIAVDSTKVKKDWDFTDIYLTRVPSLIAMHKIWNDQVIYTLQS